MTDISKLSDDEAKAMSCEDVVEMKQVEVRTPGVALSEFRFYLSDADADPPNAWRCEVFSGQYRVRVGDVQVSDALGEKTDLSAMMGRIWLAAKAAK